MAADGSLYADEARRRVEDIHDAVVAEVRRLATQLDTKKGSAELDTDREALATAERVRQQIVEVMRRRGIAEVSNVVDAAAFALAEAAAEDSKLGDFTPEMEHTVERLISGQLDEIAAAFGEAEDEIGKAMRVATATSAPLGELIDDVAARLDVAFYQAETVVDAAVRACGRRVVVDSTKETAAAEGTEWVFKMVGPLDKKTREFCKGLVGKCVRADDIDSLDNGTDLPAADFCGGYNCRHSWAPMPIQDAVDDGLTIVEV